MIYTKSDCDICGFEHPTQGDIRSFKYCRRIRGTVCDKCCKKCEYNKEWHCVYDPAGRQRMRKLIFTNRAAEMKLEEYHEKMKKTKSSTIFKIYEEIAKGIELAIRVREEEYERIRSGEINLIGEQVKDD